MFRLRRLQAIALAAALLLLPWTPAQVRPQAALSAPPYHSPRSHDYDVQHYKIAVSFDWSRESVAGETTITLRPLTAELKEVEIDAGEMTINSVKLASGAPLQYRYEKNEDLFVSLDRVYTSDQDVAISIGYTAAPSKGLTFITPTDSDPTRPYQIWSQGETEMNHYWFPCYDYPNDKATSEVIATVDEKYQAISNGVLAGVQPNAAQKTKTWHWRMDRPFSSYLVSIVVGQFAEVREQYKSFPIISYVYEDQAENARLSFAKLPRMMAFFTEKTGVDYPFASYAQTTVRDFSGAMENITATTLADTAVHDRRAHLDVSSDGLISHELAHSWFGNMITCGDWGELWLNEGFASFFAALWTEHDLGRDDYLYEMMENRRAYFQAWNESLRRPLATRRFDDPENLFDAYNYQRAAAVIGILRVVLGEDRFWKAIRHYAKKHAWQNVETKHLIDAIEEATGQNLQWFFDQWVYRMGHPEIELATRYDESSKTLRLTVKQTQKPDVNRPWFPSPDFFKMPVEIAVTTAAGEKIHRVLVDKPDKEFSIPVGSKPLIVNFDRGDYSIKQVRHSFSDDQLKYQLLHDADVTGRLRAAADLRIRKTDAAAQALAEAVSKDPFWGVRLDAVKALGDFRNDTARAALIEAAKDGDSRVRRAAIQGLIPYKDQQLADLFINIINRDPSYFAVAEAGLALGVTGSPRGYEVLAALVKQESWQDTIRQGAMAGLAALRDPRSLNIALRHAKPGNAALVRTFSFLLLGEVGKGSPEALGVLTAALSESTYSQMMLAAVQALGRLGDAQAIPILERFAARPDLPPAARGAVSGTINRLKGVTAVEKKPT